MWLEGLLKNADFAWVMISHDRYFLDRTVTEIAEINKIYSGESFSRTVTTVVLSNFDKNT